MAINFMGNVYPSADITKERMVTAYLPAAAIVALLRSIVPAMPGVPAEFNAALDLANTLLRWPILCGVLINPLSFKMASDAEVSTSMVIKNNQKVNTTDNIAPKPRVWSCRGIIKGILGADIPVINPVTEYQLAILDGAVHNRQPVPLRCPNGYVVDVLVSSLEAEQDHRDSTAYHIEFTAEEFIAQEDAGNIVDKGFKSAVALLR